MLDFFAEQESRVRVRSFLYLASAIGVAPASAIALPSATRPPGIPAPPPAPRPFDDPALRAEFTHWETRFYAAVDESAAALAAARLAVSRKGSAPPGSPDWSSARDAILRLIETRRRLQDRLTDLGRINFRYQGKASAPDLRRLRDIAEWQGRFYGATEANVTGVLTDLVRDR